jgi:hypothetical protein
MPRESRRAAAWTTATGDRCEEPAEDRTLLEPDEVLACALICRMLDTTPGAREAIKRRGVVIVVEVPSDAWVHVVGEAWRPVVNEADTFPEDGDGYGEAENDNFDPKAPWLEFRRTGDGRGKPGEGNGAVHKALRDGRSIVGFSPSPERYLPRDLVRVADLRLTLPAPNPESIVDTVALVCDERPTTPPPSPEVAAVVGLDEVLLARRASQDANEYLERICALASKKLHASPLRLEALHGMDEAVRWGKSLTQDLRDYRGGALSWSSVDRGVLVYGPPGTGKTTLDGIATRTGVVVVGTCNHPERMDPASGYQTIITSAGISTTVGAKKNPAGPVPPAGFVRAMRLWAGDQKLALTEPTTVAWQYLVPPKHWLLDRSVS